MFYNILNHIDCTLEISAWRVFISSDAIDIMMISLAIDSLCSYRSVTFQLRIALDKISWVIQLVACVYHDTRKKC